MFQQEQDKMRLILIANNIPLAAGLDKVNIDSK